MGFLFASILNIKKFYPYRIIREGNSAFVRIVKIHSTIRRIVESPLFLSCIY